MLCYFRKVMFPYLDKKRAELNLSSDYLALLTFDNFKGSVLMIYSNYLILTISMLSLFQPIALTGCNHLI